VKVTARVTSADGKPLASAKAEVVAVNHVLASGVVSDGALAVTVPDPMPPVWGLTINGQPVIAFPVTASTDSINMGEIVLAPQGLAIPAFHSVQGRVFGAPTGTSPTLATPATPATPVTRPTAVESSIGSAVTAQEVDFLKAVPLRVLFDSTAQQLSSVVDTSQRVKLTGATMTVRGLPTGSGSDLSLQFPNSDLAKNANGLSEVSFGLRPNVAGAVATKPPPASALPDLSGYTRELALRKLASVGLAATVASELVADPRAVGRIVRQLPKAGTTANPDEPVQIFIGVAGGH